VFIILSRTVNPVMFITLLLLGEFGIDIPIPNTRTQIEARFGSATREWRDEVFLGFSF
jgi:hypothetical protein